MVVRTITIVCIAFLLGCTKDVALAPISSGTTGTGGSMARFTIVGNYLYAVDKTNLKVFDIGRPADPVLKTEVPVGFEIETIFPFGDKLFIGSTSVVHIFSISDPARPEKLSEAISPAVMRRCDPVVAKDTVAFATLRVTGECGGTNSILAVYDIRQITKPVQKAAVPVTEPYGLGYSGNTLYVCDRRQLLIFDITQPFAPKFATSIADIEPVDVIPYGNVLVVWTRQGMSLFDISTPLQPKLLTAVN